MRDIFESQRRSLHREVWDLLPWHVNGSLDDAQSGRVEKHLAECGECRAEHATQLALQQQMRADETVVQTPHAALRKLMARIEHEDSMPAVIASEHSRPSRRTRWLAAAVVVQAIGLITLAGVMTWKLQEIRAAPRYETVSSSIAPGSRKPAARVVFAASLSIGELAELLRSVNAQIIAGPSEAGVYTLVFADAVNDQAAAVAVVRLREHTDVRFAELATGAGR